MRKGSIMKTAPSLLCIPLLLFALTGCDDILSVDNYDAPGSPLTGRVVFEGQGVGVRSNGVQLELWEPAYPLRQKIPVHVAQDGSFAAMLFDGSYKLNLLANNGPWLSTLDTIDIEVRGGATVEVPVTPYYTIRNEQIRHNRTGGGPNGTIEATFTVGMVNTTRQVEWVGLYVGLTTFVDRINSLTIPNAQRERLRALVQTQLDARAPITIGVQLPANIYETQSPARREYVFVRVGVKTVGVTEMLFSPVQKIGI
jgi:hypothetical protein